MACYEQGVEGYGVVFVPPGAARNASPLQRVLSPAARPKLKDTAAKIFFA